VVTHSADVAATASRRIDMRDGRVVSDSGSAA
jgi:ABC-type lipoprotein export system ATPase subunit